MATERKHLAIHLDNDLYNELERLREQDKGKGVLTMSKYAGRIIAEYVSRERWRLREKKYSEDSDFE